MADINLDGTGTRSRSAATTETTVRKYTVTGARHRNVTATESKVVTYVVESDRVRTSDTGVFTAFEVDSPTAIAGWESTARTRTAIATIQITNADDDDDGLPTTPWVSEPDESGDSVIWAPVEEGKPALPINPSHSAPRALGEVDLPIRRHYLRKQWFVITDPPDFDDNHQPISSTWPLTRHASDWGFYRIFVGHKNVTFFRRAQTLITDLSDTEPGGDDTCALIFPAIGPHEALGVGDLDWLPARHGDEHVPVRLVQIQTDGSPDLNHQFEGDLIADEDNYDGQSGQLLIRVNGLIKTLDDRITKHRFGVNPIDVGLAIHRLVNYEAKYGWPGHPPAIIDTGVETADHYGYGDALYSNTIVNLLAQLQHGHTRYVLTNERPRGMKMVEKNVTDIDITLMCGQPGVTQSLINDASRRYDALFGEGQTDGIRYWRNTQYPNAHISGIPMYPGGTGFGPGDIDSDLSKFFRELRHHGYDVDSHDTYLSRDEDDVIEFQKDAGVTADGVIRAQTWNAAFLASRDENVLAAYIRPLAVRSTAEPFLYNARGGIIGDNPDYTGRPRREVLRQYGTLSRKQARHSAKEELFKSDTLTGTDYIGTITLTNVDPPERCALTIRSGMNLLFRSHRGTDRTFHISRVERDPGMVAGSNRTVILTVSERGDDYMTIAERILRHRNVLDQSGRVRAPRHISKHTPDFAPWDQESGAGFLRPLAMDAKKWQCFPIPAGTRGSIVHTRLIADPPTLISAAVFNWHVNPDQLDRLPGLTNPHQGDTSKDPVLDPWQQNADKLSRAPQYADQSWLAFASGSLDSMQGYWPADPLNSGDTDLTGVFDDSMTWPFHARHAPWLWVAIWTRDACTISGDPDYDYRALWPAPDS